MADQRAGGISWTNETWNVIRGCRRVSEGCRNCYAERVAGTRLAGPGQAYHGIAEMTPAGPRWTGKVELVEDLIDLPLRWTRARLVFVNAMSDLFYEGLADIEIDRVVATMVQANRHTFQVLTKRPERMAAYLSAPDRRDRIAAELRRRGDFLRATIITTGLRLDDSPPLPRWPIPNVWWGFSAEDQASFNDRIRSAEECRVHAAILWVSIEPLIGPIDLLGYRARLLSARCHKCGRVRPDSEYSRSRWNTFEPWACPDCNHGGFVYMPLIDWVVVGGESGPAARPMDPRWVRAIRNECKAQGVPFHFKQWGEWVPISWLPDTGEEHKRQGLRSRQDPSDPDRGWLWAGKKAAGRLLDGVVHDAMPAVPAGR